jgi:hypothetical protein
LNGGRLRRKRLAASKAPKRVPSRSRRETGRKRFLGGLKPILAASPIAKLTDLAAAP